MTSTQRELLQGVIIISKLHKGGDATGSFSVQCVAQIEKFYKVFSDRSVLFKDKNIEIFLFHPAEGVQTSYLPVQFVRLSP